MACQYRAGLTIGARKNSYLSLHPSSIQRWALSRPCCCCPRPSAPRAATISYCECCISLHARINDSIERAHTPPAYQPENVSSREQASDSFIVEREPPLVDLQRLFLAWTMCGVGVGTVSFFSSARFRRYAVWGFYSAMANMA